MYSLFNRYKRPQTQDHSIPLSANNHPTEQPAPYQPAKLVRSLSEGTGESLFRMGAISLNTSRGMNTYLDCPKENTLEETATHSFIHHLLHNQSGAFRSSFAHLLGAKNGISHEVVNQFLAGLSRPAVNPSSEEAITSPIAEKIFSKLNTSKDIGFLFVELVHEASPMTFRNNKKLICFVSLSQEAVIDENKFQTRATTFRKEFNKARDELASIDREMLLENSLPKNERNQARLKALKQDRKSALSEQIKMEKKLEKLEEAHKRYHEMRPHIKDINQSVHTTARLLNADNNCPVYFIPTLKFDNGFVGRFLSHIDNIRSASFKAAPPAAKEMMSEYLEIKEMGEDDKKAAMALFEKMMTSETPVLTKSCSEKMLTNTMLKLIRLALADNYQSVSLHFKHEMHYPLSPTDHNLEVAPSPHANCKNCQFTYFLVHTSLKTDLKNIIDCLSEDDGPVQEIRAVALDPYNKALEKQRALLMNITDILNDRSLKTNLTDPLSKLRQSIASLSKKNLCVFEYITDLLWDIVSHIGPDTIPADIHKASACCKEISSSKQPLPHNLVDEKEEKQKPAKNLMPIKLLHTGKTGARNKLFAPLTPTPLATLSHEKPKSPLSFTRGPN